MKEKKENSETASLGVHLESSESRRQQLHRAMTKKSHRDEPEVVFPRSEDKRSTVGKSKKS